MLRWYGHVERIARRVQDSSDQRRQGRPTRVWMDGVKEAVTNRGLTLEHEATVTAHDRVGCRCRVNRA